MFLCVTYINICTTLLVAGAAVPRRRAGHPSGGTGPHPGRVAHTETSTHRQGHTARTENTSTRPGKGKRHIYLT